jgi:hypothetical protein
MTQRDGIVAERSLGGSQHPPVGPGGGAGPVGDGA